jgi:hypothetical protein
MDWLHELAANQNFLHCIPLGLLDPSRLGTSCAMVRWNFHAHSTHIWQWHGQKPLSRVELVSLDYHARAHVVVLTGTLRIAEFNCLSTTSYVHKQRVEMMTSRAVRALPQNHRSLVFKVATSRNRTCESASLPLVLPSTLRCRRCVWAAASDDQERISLHKDDGEATFAPLDASSTGGLGGTSSDVFGPLVRSCSVQEVYLYFVQLFLLHVCQVAAVYRHSAQQLSPCSSHKPTSIAFGTSETSYWTEEQ